jgi:hypothetical protein
MQISEKERAILEDALDRLFMMTDDRLSIGNVKAITIYTKALGIVRERPAGTRRVRSDAGAKRATKNAAVLV